MFHLPLMVEKNVMPSSLSLRRGKYIPILSLPFTVTEDAEVEEEYNEEEEEEEESIFDPIQEHWNKQLDKFLENENDEEQAAKEIENLLVQWKISIESKTKLSFPSNTRNLTPRRSENSKSMSISSEAKTMNINSMNSGQNLNDTNVHYRRYHPIAPLDRVCKRLESTSSSSSCNPDFPSPHFVLPTSHRITPATDMDVLDLKTDKLKMFLSGNSMSFQTSLHHPLSCSSVVTLARPTATDQSCDPGPSDVTCRDSVHCFSYLWTRRNNRYDCFTGPPSPSVPLEERRVLIHNQQSNMVLRSLSINSWIKARFVDLRKYGWRIREVVGSMY